MKANLVIIGSGIVGSSVAYHLAKMGWRDIILLDKGDPIENPGSTSHAPGGVVALSHSKLLTQMGQYASALYRSLAPHAPYHRNTYNWVGGLDIAISQARWDDLKRLWTNLAADPRVLAISVPRVPAVPNAEVDALNALISEAMGERWLDCSNDVGCHIMIDGLHLSEAGYKVVRQYIERAHR